MQEKSIKCWLITSWKISDYCEYFYKIFIQIEKFLIRMKFEILVVSKIHLKNYKIGRLLGLKFHLCELRWAARVNSRSKFVVQLAEGVMQEQLMH